MDKINVLPPEFYKLPLNEKRKFLQDNADDIQRGVNVTRPLNPDEKDSKKEELIQATIKLANAQEEYDRVKAEWKETLDPMKKESKELTDLVRTGYEQLQTDVFMIRDHEKGRVYSLLMDGTLIDDRRMMEHERQTTVTGNVRSITHGL